MRGGAFTISKREKEERKCYKRVYIRFKKVEPRGEFRISKSNQKGFFQTAEHRPEGKKEEIKESQGGAKGRGDKHQARLHKNTTVGFLVQFLDEEFKDRRRKKKN